MLENQDRGRSANGLARTGRARREQNLQPKCFLKDRLHDANIPHIALGKRVGTKVPRPCRLDGSASDEVTAIDRLSRDKYHRNEKSHALGLSKE